MAATVAIDVDASGQFLNPWRRKFLMKLNLGSSDDRRKDNNQAISL